MQRLGPLLGPAVKQGYQIGRSPRAQVFDLAGRLVATLPAPTSDGVAHTFTWSGRNAAGHAVRPGAYLLHLDLGADAGEDTVLRSIAVAY